MNRIRVLVVDDSVVVRRLVSEVLSEDPQIEVVGTANNGRVGVAKVEELTPDLVTLDIEMPEMNGIEALREIRRRHPRLPVIMFSTLTQAGASATLDALAAGASDYVTKPSNVGSIAQGMQAVREQLTPKVHALCRVLPPRISSSRPLSSVRPLPVVRPAAPLGRALTTRPLAPLGAMPVRRASPRREHRRVDVLVIGSSTGGPNALATVFAQLPRDLGVPVLITQHMPPMFTTLFAERLTKLGTIPVVEATNGAVLRPNHALIAPGDHHLVLDPRAPQGRVKVNQDPPVNSCRPAVDPMFASAAKVFGAHVLAVVLTGMGSDGLAGCHAVVEAGGQVLTQDEATSVVWGMPGHVTQAGLADAVLPIERIAGEIAHRIARGRPVGAGAARSIG